MGGLYQLSVGSEVAGWPRVGAWLGWWQGGGAGGVDLKHRGRLGVLELVFKSSSRSITLLAASGGGVDLTEAPVCAMVHEARCRGQ